MTWIIRGTIAGSVQPVDYVKHNGKKSRKSVLHIVAEDGKEVAVTVTGDLLNWVGCDGMRVEVEYQQRVANNHYRSLPWMCNDIYAVRISACR